MITKPEILALVILAAGAACADETATDSTHRATGKTLLLPFKQNLKAALVSGLEEGAVSAISVCKDQAPAIANALSTDGVVMGRTSHRLRNPANASPEWAAGILASYLAAGADPKPELTDLPDDRIGYAEPIVVQPLCLACHGQSLAPEVAERINEMYPADAATGFGIGDLRGLYWVEFPRSDSTL